MQHRAIPGTIVSPTRGFAYVEGTRREVRALLHGICQAAMAIATDPDGGVLSENAEIELPNRVRLQAVSFNRDLALWRQAVSTYAKSSDRRWGEVDGSVIIVGGTPHRLSTCSVRFY